MKLTRSVFARRMAVFGGILGLVIARGTLSFAGLVVEEVEDPAHGRITVFHMAVTPAAEPVPALRHRLWLKPHELQPGNSVGHYFRALGESNLRGPWKRLSEKFGEAVDDLYTYHVPMERLPLEDVRYAASQFDSVIGDIVHQATLCRDTDWGLDPVDLTGPETYSYVLGGFQELRSAGRAISLRTRLAIAERRYDDAIEHLRMNYRLGQDVGQELFLVCKLIGIAIEGIANTNVIDFIAAPDSPNLYWALSEVPSPLVDCREAIRWEMGFGTRLFPPLIDVEAAEHSPAEWARLIGEGIKAYGAVGNTEGFEPMTGVSQLDATLRGLVGMGYSLVAYPQAKRRLMDSGMSQERVEAMPVGQVIAIDTAREYRSIADEQEKWWYVPFPQARQRMANAEELLTKSESSFGSLIARMVLPALKAVRNAEVRMQWHKNAFLTLEALRMHAAVNGKFPESLNDIRAVPVPENPITREPYVYRLEDGMAIVELPFSDGMPGIAWRFEMKLAEQE